MTFTCSYCKKSFEVSKFDNRRKYQFCSANCYRKFRKEKAVNKPSNCICGICGKEFYRKPSAIKNGEGKFCSIECKHQDQRLGIEIRGESYKDRHLLRQSSVYKSWRQKAKQLKGNKCEKCGIKDRTTCKCCGNRIYLHVNHVKLFSIYPKLRFEPTNATVLCPKCHLGL